MSLELMVRDEVRRTLREYTAQWAASNNWSVRFLVGGEEDTVEVFGRDVVVRTKQSGSDVVVTVKVPYEGEEARRRLRCFVEEFVAPFKSTVFEQAGSPLVKFAPLLPVYQEVLERIESGFDDRCVVVRAVSSKNRLYQARVKREGLERQVEELRKTAPSRKRSFEEVEASARELNRLVDVQRAYGVGCAVLDRVLRPVMLFFSQGAQSFVDGLIRHKVQFYR